MTTVFASYPSLSNQGISAYTFMAAQLKNASMFNVPIPINGYYGIFMLPLLHPENSTESLKAAIDSVFAEAKKPYADNKTVVFITSVTSKEYGSFYEYFVENNGPEDGGHDQFLGSRLLDDKALTGNRKALEKALRSTSESGIVTAHLVGGKGVHDTGHIPGGGNAVNPAWRKAYLHASEFSYLSLIFCINVSSTFFPPAFSIVNSGSCKTRTNPQRSNRNRIPRPFLPCRNRSSSKTQHALRRLLADTSPGLRCVY